jgi:hypothetical protein
MRYIHTYCYNVINEDCSRRAHEKIGLDFATTQKCVDDSFTSKDKASINTNNTIIDEEIKYWKAYGSGIFPSIVINNKTYKG